ncbi:PREDICTED: formin-J, partial [Rhagoletis zephyria]|uniref:formin-J n=1 Tax=Rhagoletis zephyria TaxID=28612 RepID=UPI000811631D
GACWRSSQSNGKCSEIYLRNSTKAECCRYSELFYTDRDVTDVELFFATTIGDGMTCSPCASGACWRSSQSNGKCSEIYLRNSTKAECCRYSELFYTDRDVTDVELFFATTIGDGMTCSPCALSCKSMQCSWNKKCVKRKGRPKCVCAPECGAAKRHKQRSQQRTFRGHEPHSEQLRLNRHIVLGSDGISGGRAGGGGVVGKAGNGAGSATSTLFGEGKSPRDIRSLSSEITNVNLGVEHQLQMQQQNQRKMIIMQSQSQQKPQLSRRVENSGRLLITANAEHDTEKPVQRRLQIFSNIRTNSRHHKSFDDDFNNGDEDDGDESAEGVDAEDREVDGNNEDADNDGDIDDWLDDGSEEASSGNHRRSSDDSARTPTAPPESRRSLNLPSRHKTNKNSNHNKKRRLHENEMEVSKRQQENSNNNNFAIIKRFQLAALQPSASSRVTATTAATSNARQLENAPNHDEMSLAAGGGILNGNSANNNNNNNNNHKTNSNSRNNVNGGRQRERHHHHQQHQQQQLQRKRKHHQHQKQLQQQQHQQQEQQQKQQQQQQQQPPHQQSDHQHNHRAHKKHKKLKDHNANNNGNNVRTRTSSATSSLTAHSGDSIMPATTIATTATATATAMTTTAVPTTMDWQTTAATATPVNSMSPSDDRRLLNHGSHIAKSSPSLSSSSSSSLATKQEKLSTSSEAFFGGVVSADVGKSFRNSDDSTLLDGIYDNFNVYGFPNRQFEVAVENFHGPHPVCGTDGRTYNTECQLKKRACRTNNPSLTVAYRGHCRTSCNGVKCLGGLTCVEDQYTIPHCIACKIDCPEDDAAAAASHAIDPKRAVCGVDGKTYRSVCDINRMICKSGRSIAVAYPGPCRADRPTCNEINCGHKHTCLVDLLTHEPRCVTCSYKCARKRRPTSLRFEEGKICGVNNHTYNSWCELRRDSCNTGFFIDIKSPGECN